MSDAILRISDLSVDLVVERARARVLHGVGFDVAAGEAVGLVGESGAGKSMTARAVAALLPKGATSEGTVEVGGENVVELRGERLRQYRLRVMAMIFQDPRAAFDPVQKIGDALSEPLRTALGMSAGDARSRVCGLLEEMGIPDAWRRLRQYPHELSGGLLQRCMIAQALSTEPEILVADEPTTALDVTTQSEVMAILDDQRHRRNLALLFITHDLDLAAAVCDRICVMYAGRVVENRAAADLHSTAMHPYTRSLLRARPTIDQTADRLEVIPGRPRSAYEAPSGCPFRDRCRFSVEACADDQVLRPVNGGMVRCHRAEELAGCS